MVPASTEQIQSILKSIDAALDAGAEPIAAFDADGTLWDTDLGEAFFDFQIKNKLLPNLPADPWQHYKSMNVTDTAKSYMWLAQINKGQKLSVVREWAQAALNEFKPVPVFSEVQKIINHLLSRKVDIYIVTASVQWAVEPGAAHLAIPRDNVIGVLTQVENGVITDKPQGAVSWREGKVTRLLEKTNHKRPFLAAGNTMGDLALLESASHIKVVNCGAKPGDRIYETERKLVDIAQQKGWFCFTY